MTIYHRIITIYFKAKYIHGVNYLGLFVPFPHSFGRIIRFDYRNSIALPSTTNIYEVPHCDRRAGDVKRWQVRTLIMKTLTIPKKKNF